MVTTNKSNESINSKLLDKVVDFKHHHRMKLGMLLIVISILMTGLTFFGIYSSNPSLMYRVFGLFGICGILIVLLNFIQIKKAKNYEQLFGVDQTGLRKIQDNLSQPVYEKEPLILTNDYIFFLSNSCKKLFIGYDEIATIKYGKADLGAQNQGLLQSLFMPKMLNFLNNNGKCIASVSVKENNMGEIKEKLLGINSRFAVQ